MSRPRRLITGRIRAICLQTQVPLPESAVFELLTVRSLSCYHVNRQGLRAVNVSGGKSDYVIRLYAFYVLWPNKSGFVSN